ncbi:MAG: dihydrolipoyl dehydrogenase [Actinomycetota bacterium]|nr:dihydrolipoyl dehydrogenase [Actinomycetota bacterium]
MDKTEAATGGPYDLVVLGGGPGGYAAALYAASAGMSVALVERDKVGGTCLHRGCVPAKELLETAAVFRTVAEAAQFGVQASAPVLELPTSQVRKQKVVDQLWKGLSGLMKSRRIEVFQAEGRLQADRSIALDDGRTVTGRHVLLATGSLPRSLEGFSFGGRTILSSDEVLDLKELPSTAVVIGGGAIGCEFASLLSDLGSAVTLIEAMPTLLPGCDEDVVEVVLRSFRKRRIDVRTSTSVTGHHAGGTGTVVDLADGGSVEAEAVVVAVGRRPLSDGIAESGAGVALDARGFVEVDSRMRTSAEGVWAVGDVVATPQLAHVGFAEAVVAVKDMLGEGPVPVDYHAVPWCIYSRPEVAFAGYSEEQAKRAGFEVVVKKDPFGGNSRARILGETDGVVKVIAERLPDGRAGRILGVHMAGPWVTEQLGQAYLAVNWEATPDEVAAYLQPHPTLSEAFGETVLALTGRGLHVG